MTGLRSTTLSYKNEKLIRHPESEQILVENTHEALVTPELWDIVQDVRQHKKRAPKHMDEPNMFSGLVYCADCGRTMVIHRAHTIHYRQLNKNLKKISEKFKGEKILTNKNYNIGIVVIQFATSIEEFYSYMFNPDKGLINKLDFANLDSIVFFSLTPKCGLDMQDVLDLEHIFTVMLNNG